MSVQTLLQDAKFNDDIVDPELYASTAEKLAKAIAESGARSRDANKGTQLRRFYDEVCRWQDNVKQQPDKFNEYLPFIQMIRARVAYAKGRGLVDDSFYDLINHCLGQVKTAVAFDRFKLFFEAFMGYYKMHNQK